MLGRYLFPQTLGLSGVGILCAIINVRATEGTLVMSMTNDLELRPETQYPQTNHGEVTL